jgi:hypothetical protein
MIVFKVMLNGKALPTAGIPGRAVLTAVVTWVRRLKSPPAGTETEEKLEFHVGWLDSNGEDWENGCSLSWFNGRLKVGDRLTLEIVEQETADPPAHSSRQPKRVQRMTRLRSARQVFSRRHRTRLVRHSRQASAARAKYQELV